MQTSSSGSDLLQVENLRLYFHTRQGVVRAVDDINVRVPKNRVLAVIGESGSGKSSLLRAILRLLPRNVHTYTGKVFLDGQDLMSFSNERFRREVRWTRISFVPQAAMNALNPVIKVSHQVVEPLLVHRRATTNKDAMILAEETFQSVGVPKDFIHRYPFELSGGMRQRVAIAMALITRPDLVLMDEPTSALDVLTQANLLNTLKTMQQTHGASFLIITHEMATAAEIADDVAVMYGGEIVERADARSFFREPSHPYSRKLIATVPKRTGTQQLGFIPGEPPSLINPPRGCRFAERCPSRFSRCQEAPPAFHLNDGRTVRCWLYERGATIDAQNDSAVRS